MGRLNLGLAGTCLAAGLFAVGYAFWRHPDNILGYPLDAVMLVGPAMWLVVAAMLSCGDRTPTRLTVTVAAGLTAVLQAEELAFWLDDDWMLSAAHNATRGMKHAPALLAVAAVVPAAVGWWQRRHERLAADPDDAP